MNTEEFLKNASSKNKNVGNNKYQDEIKNLNNKINEMVKSIKSKDEELDLFKRNFTDMQIHIQEKNIKTTAAKAGMIIPSELGEDEVGGGGGEEEHPPASSFVYVLPVGH